MTNELRDNYGNKMKEGFYIGGKGEGEIPIYVSRSDKFWVTESIEDGNLSTLVLDQSDTNFLVPANSRFVKNFIEGKRTSAKIAQEEACFYEARLPKSPEDEAISEENAQAALYQLQKL